MIKSPIISCSRRTDVPAFLMDWVLENINIGYVDVVNPFNKNQISRISLSPEDVKCWVWWSKNLKQWIEIYQDNKELFKSYKGHYFQFTINSPSELEKGLEVSLDERIEQYKWLSKEFGNQSISYRFDPIITYMKKGSTKVISNLNKFEYIIDNLASYGLKEMIFSFATIYSKVDKRMRARGYVPIDLKLEKKKHILQKIKTITDKFNIELRACCQPDLLAIEGIKQAHCIDANRIEKIIGESIVKTRDTGQRKECGCFKSRDIGGYTGIFKCKHNCAYCYASPAKR